MERRRKREPIDRLTLARPTYELVPSFVEMRDAFMELGEDEWNIRGEEIAHTDPYAYVDLMNDRAQGRNVADGFVRADEFWIVREGLVVGSVSVRRELNEGLRRIGGHVGYSTHPAYRRRGVATFALKSALAILEDLGVAEALVTCRADNAASIAVIEKCAGRRIEDAEIPEYPDRTRRRYLVPTKSADAS
jgi:predicted acetyltransferase